MKTTLTFVALLAIAWPACAVELETRQSGSLVDAITKLPSCATPCVLSAAGNSSCGLTNATCLCQSKVFEASTEACIFSKCSVINSLSSKNLFEITCDRPVRNRSAEYARVNWAMIGLTTVIVFARLIYKYLSPLRLGLDDLFAFLAYLAVLPSFAINLAGLIPAGIGRDIWTLTPSQIDAFGFWFYIVEPLYFIQMGLVKMAILFFFLRIFETSGLEPLLWATVAFNAANTIAFLFPGIFQCTPISYYWYRWQGTYEGTCININAVAWANAIISIVLDLWMLGLPLSKIQSLNLHWWKKMAAGLMFCVGTFVTIISVLRLHSLVLFATSNNPTWDQYGMALWTTLEVPIGIICSCLPAIRQILIKAIPGIFGRLTKLYGERSPANSGATDTDIPQHTDKRISRGPRTRPNSLAVEGASTARHSRATPNNWDSISEIDDTSQLYDLRDLERNGEDKETSRERDTLTPASSIGPHSAENRLAGSPHRQG
ncbi:putative PTH11-type G-protein coupled receptor protein [Plectosphaerella plurivora]|uniref:PTH11-type G-protein coupled receptor protein n=1 Tax=Plectosphaerella plurivora TaxID=936078 RepID=A0A9P8VBQ3_9PEZI|nr:putative PTH11-type G-protein coupled receptor protein [Plectosphaerella plurivora]